ncbi:hypothetical protein RB195_006518 [Necator americanus]|uniref:Uncharacterized protein n=1 Tax=Necator americanus TaxID=51031 RepID=A0ABR1BVS8_NECAM
MQFDPTMDDNSLKTIRRRIRRVKVALVTEASKLENVLENYGNAADNLDMETPSISDIMSRVKTDIEAVQGLLDWTRKVVTNQKRLQQDFDSSQNYDQPITECPRSKADTNPNSEIQWTNLGMGNFWRWFDHSVHSRNIDGLFKLNYLLDALQGDANKSVKQFEVSGNTYPLVIEHLKEKYSDKQALVDQLLHKFTSTKAKRERLEEQKMFCEQLHSIISQSHFKGEHIDNTFLQKELLAKFSMDTQRHILRQKARDENENTWNTMMLLSAVKEYVKSELKIIRQVEQYQTNSTREQNHHRRQSKDTSKINTKLRPVACFHCGHLFFHALTKAITPKC